jgi:hypothetical protein
MDSLGMIDSAGAVDEYLDELLHSPQHAAALDTPDKKESCNLPPSSILLPVLASLTYLPQYRSDSGTSTS